MFLLVWNIFKPVSGIPLDGKYLIWEVKNPALIQLNLAAEVDIIPSEDKWCTSLAYFGALGTAPHHFQQYTQPRRTNLSHSPGLTSACRRQCQVCWQKSSSSLCAGQCNMRFSKINKLFYYNFMCIFTHENIIALLTSAAYNKCKFCPLSNLLLFFISSLSVLLSV